MKVENDLAFEEAENGLAIGVEENDRASEEVTVHAFEVVVNDLVHVVAVFDLSNVEDYDHAFELGNDLEYSLKGFCLSSGFGVLDQGCAFLAEVANVHRQEGRYSDHDLHLEEVEFVLYSKVVLGGLALQRSVSVSFHDCLNLFRQNVWVRFLCGRVEWDVPVAMVDQNCPYL